MVLMPGRDGRYSARIRASSLPDRPTGTDAGNWVCKSGGEAYGLWPPASVPTVAGSQGCGLCHSDPVIGPPRVISGLPGTNGVTSNTEATSMIPLEDAEDLRVLYLRRYHLNQRITAPSSERAATVLMTDPATTPTCDFFDRGVVGCVAVGCGFIVVLLSLIFFTGILRMVSQALKNSTPNTDFWNNGANIAPCAALRRRRRSCLICYGGH